MASLSTQERNNLPASAFALPGDRAYPIHDLSHARNALARAAGKPEEAKVKAAVFKKFPDLAKMGKTEISVPLWKDDAQQLVYGVVMTPGVMDSQGDVASAEEIQKAAHRFLTEYRKHDIQHAEQVAGVETVECYIAPMDMEIAGEKVLKGAWVMATHVSDPETWQRVVKEDHPQPLTGYSVGGSAIREPITA